MGNVKIESVDSFLPDSLIGRKDETSRSEGRRTKLCVLREVGILVKPGAPEGGT